METPPQRMSMDENPRAPRSNEVITGDALTSLSASIDAHAHAVKASADTQTGPSEAVSDQGTVSFKGRSHPVSADEAERLLAWLDEHETSGWSSNADARAAGCLRRVAGRLLNADKSRTSLDEESTFNSVSALLAAFRAAAVKAVHQRVSVLDSPSSPPETAEQPSDLVLDSGAHASGGARLPTVRSGQAGIEDMIHELDKLAAAGPDTPGGSDGEGSGEERSASGGVTAKSLSGTLTFMRSLSKKVGDAATRAGEEIASAVESALNKLDVNEEESAKPQAAPPASDAVAAPASPMAVA